MTKEIEITVSDRVAVQVGGPRAIVSDNTDYVVRFAFGEEWQAYDRKTVLFVRDDGTCYPPAVLEDGQDGCKIPRLSGTGHIRIGITAVMSQEQPAAGSITTTTPAEIPVLPSVLAFAGQVLDYDSCEPTAPAEVWDWVLKKLDELEQDSCDPTAPEQIAEAVEQYLAENPITGPEGKSAYQYAVEGGYTGTEAEFAAKLAAEMPAALPNPYALTFTGAVTGCYDGSEETTINIPAVGGEEWRLITTVTITEEVREIEIHTDSDGNPFSISEFLIYAPLGVITSATAQLILYGIAPGAEPDQYGTYPWERISSSTNGFIGTSTKSLAIRSEWCGMRYTMGASSTYDFAIVAAPLEYIRLSNLFPLIGGIKLWHGNGNFTAGTFYIYGK